MQLPQRGTFRRRRRLRAHYDGDPVAVQPAAARPGGPERDRADDFTPAAAMGLEQRDAMRAAFEIATGASERIAADWQNGTTPDRRQFRPGAEKNYTRYQDRGAWPFAI